MSDSASDAELSPISKTGATSDRQSAGQRAAADVDGFHIEPVEPQSFSASSIGKLRHNFHEHPLFEMDQLRRLAKSLAPLEKCRFLKPGVDQRSEFWHESASHDGRDIDEVFDRITEPGSWIALYEINNDPLYGRFLENMMSQLRALTEPEQSGLFGINGFMFISAPPSVTPFHIDRENNYWLQLRGRKVVSLWDHRRRDVVAQKAVENFIMTGDLSDVRMSDEIERNASLFDVGPGDGLFFPSTTPHATKADRSWVKPGEEVSISLAVVFYTSQTQRAARVHAFNKVIRRFTGLGLPEPGGALLDRVRAPLGQGVVAAMQRLRGFKPPTGFYR